MLEKDVSDVINEFSNKTTPEAFSVNANVSQQVNSFLGASKKISKKKKSAYEKKKKPAPKVPGKVFKKD